MACRDSFVLASLICFLIVKKQIVQFIRFTFNKLTFRVLLSSIIGGGVVYKFTLFGKTGAVAGAVPSVLDLVVFKCTTEVGTPWHCGCKESYD